MVDLSVICSWEWHMWMFCSMFSHMLLYLNDKDPGKTMYTAVVIPVCYYTMILWHLIFWFTFLFFQSWWPTLFISSSSSNNSKQATFAFKTLKLSHPPFLSHSHLPGLHWGQSHSFSFNHLERTYRRVCYAQRQCANSQSQPIDPWSNPAKSTTTTPARSEGNSQLLSH